MPHRGFVFLPDYLSCPTSITSSPHQNDGDEFSMEERSNGDRHSDGNAWSLRNEFVCPGAAHHHRTQVEEEPISIFTTVTSTPGRHKRSLLNSGNVDAAQVRCVNTIKNFNTDFISSSSQIQPVLHQHVVALYRPQIIPGKQAGAWL